MNEIEIDALRLRCAAAFAAYQAHANNLLVRAKPNAPPSAIELDAEEQALYEYAKWRRELLDALEAIVYVDRDV